MGHPGPILPLAGWVWELSPELGLGPGAAVTPGAVRDEPGLGLALGPAWGCN